MLLYANIVIKVPSVSKTYLPIISSSFEHSDINTKSKTILHDWFYMFQQFRIIVLKVKRTVIAMKFTVNRNKVHWTPGFLIFILETYFLWFTSFHCSHRITHDRNDIVAPNAKRKAKFTLFPRDVEIITAPLYHLWSVILWL